MTKVYIVTGIANYGESQIQETLYAGVNESKANSINIDLPYIKLILAVWIDDVLIKSYGKTDIYDWVTEFDKLHELEEERYDLQTKLNKLDDKIEDLKSMMVGGANA